MTGWAPGEAHKTAGGKWAVNFTRQLGRDDVLGDVVDSLIAAHPLGGEAVLKIDLRRRDRRATATVYVANSAAAREALAALKPPNEGWRAP